MSLHRKGGALAGDMVKDSHGRVVIVQPVDEPLGTGQVIVKYSSGRRAKLLLASVSSFRKGPGWKRSSLPVKKKISKWCEKCGVILEFEDAVDNSGLPWFAEMKDGSTLCVLDSGYGQTRAGKRRKK